MSEDKKYKCVLCGEDSIGWGHNPEPLKEFDDGRCCTMCNDTKVIPARLVGVFGPSQGLYYPTETK